jgi:sn-glycerol 3-phosphate transport system substrate-binding protein
MTKLHIGTLALASALALPAQAQTEVQWWHSMGGALGEWVNDLAKDFNASQKDYKIVPTFKGSYDESMTAAIAAFRAGNAPHILQVFEVGTATMMASKGAIVPVGKVMKRRASSSTRMPMCPPSPATTPRPTARC